MQPKRWVGFLLFIPFMLQAEGIHFENGLTWDQLVAKASAQNKNIFVDCYATWCGPCKKMDLEVYTIDSIGQYFNDRFISVKVQIDSTAKDNEEVKGWYNTAASIKNKYKIAILPSFLFFSPDGQVLHKGIGYQGGGQLLALAKNALDPKKQYYTMLESFKNHTMPFIDMPRLVSTAMFQQDAGFGAEVAGFYTNNYLMKLGDNDLYTTRNLRTLSAFTFHSTNPGFQIFYNHGHRADTVMKDVNFSRRLVERIIEQEEVNNLLYKNGHPAVNQPNWNELERNVQKKYNGDHAERVIIWAKLKWFMVNKNWPLFSQMTVKMVEKYGPFDIITNNPYPANKIERGQFLNGCAWEVFLHSTNHNELEKALRWTNEAIKGDTTADMRGAYLDTYANILYKLGRKDEAVEAEQKAFDVAKDKNAKDLINTNLKKMKDGEKTW